jgi:hypothetical protein
MALPSCLIQDEVDTPPQPAILSICVRILDQGRNERIPLFQLAKVAHRTVVCVIRARIKRTVSQQNRALTFLILRRIIA